MVNNNFNVLTEDDILEVIYDNQVNMINKINNITEYFYNIQQTCTTKSYDNHNTKHSNHSWLKINKNNENAFKNKVKIKRQCE